MSTAGATTQSTLKSSMTIFESKHSFRTSCTLLLFSSGNGMKILVPGYFLELSIAGFVYIT